MGELTQADNEALADLLLLAEEMLESGQDPHPVDLCRAHPNLLVECARKLAALRATQWLNRPLAESGAKVSYQNKSAENRLLVGRYQLEMLLGEGGHGEVWRAWDIQLGRSVAVKLPKGVGDRADRAMLAEARRVASLKHPGIVQVHDIGQDGETRFIVTDLLEGGSLAHLQAGDKYSPTQIVRWVGEIAEALDYAHRMGVVHRDIKPANILLDHHGRALLADFGISRSPAEGDANSNGSAFSGTLRYMAPEQVLGQKNTSKSDIHALGVVLHELLTGKLPYTDGAVRDFSSLRAQIAGGSRVIDSKLAPAIRAVCAKALKHDPSRRYATAGEMARDLQATATPGNQAGVKAGWLIVTMVPLLAFGAVITRPAGNVFQGEGSVFSDRVVIDKAWLARVAALPGDKQAQEVVSALKNLNFGYNGEVDGEIDGSRLWKISLCTDTVHDIRPLSALKNLTHLELTGTFGVVGNGKLTNLEPLRGLQIKTLICKYNPNLENIRPLTGMPLDTLDLWRTAVEDLGPLKGCPIRVLGFGFCGVKSIEPLRGMPMIALRCSNCAVFDLGPIEGMPMEDLRCHDTPIASLEPVRGMKIKMIECQRTKITSLEPLRGMNSLYFLNFFLTPTRDISPLTECKGLKILFTSQEIEKDNPVFKMIPSLRHLNDNSIVDNRNR